MLSLQASPCPSPSLYNSVFDYSVGGASGRDGQDLNEWRGRKRYLDGSQKGFDMTCAAYPNLSNGLEHQRPVVPLGFGRGSLGAVSRFQSETNRNLGSRYPPQDACRNMPVHDLSQSSGGQKVSAFDDNKLLDVDARFHGSMAVAPRMASSTPRVDCRPVMPVFSEGLRPPAKAHNFHPCPPHVQPTFALQNQRNQGPFIPNGAVHLRGESLPLFPPGPPPPYSQGMLLVQNPGPVISSNHPVINAYSGLIGSLLAQGVISLTNQTPPKDSIGVEFKADLLKVRHESVVTGLYGDLPRQCTTCGLRFKCQEEHRRHMDWHLTKNRMSKSLKQKVKPSRKWYVNMTLWLIVGTDAVPRCMREAETALEKKTDEVLTVPADEDQTLCALCREPFEDFYSEEAEEWMCKDAVYLNAAEGSTEGMDRSELGPIVHPNCRPEGSQRKRLRRS